MMKRIDVPFTIKVYPTLADEEGSTSATVYPTSDIGAIPTILQYNGWNDPRPFPWDDSKPPVTESPRGSFEIQCQFSLRSDIMYPADASLCVQTFCQVGNHKGERCTHRCGFAAFGLRGLATGGERGYVEKLRDAGPGIDKRGFTTIVVGRETLSALSNLRFSDPGGNDLVGQVIGASTFRRTVSVLHDYHFSARRALRDRNPTSPEISLSLLPLYTQSSGSITPSCAFLLLKEPPLATEQYYLYCLDAAIRRSAPGSVGTVTERSAMFCDDARTSTDTRASIMMDIAMTIPASCPYLFDKSMGRDGMFLVNTDEFTRTTRLTLCGDCEDGSCEGCMVLWDILTAASASGKWISRAMNILRRVRAAYVSTVALKSVTRPSESGSGGNDGRMTFAAHACCDMIPIWFLKKCLSADSSGDRAIDMAAVEVIDAIERERTWLLGYVPKRTVIGEGTGVVSSCPDTGLLAPPAVRRDGKATIIAAFPTARMVSRENITEGSGFYKYTVSAIVHDTLISPAAIEIAKKHNVRWILPQIAYHWIGDGDGNTRNGGKTSITRGCPHDGYVRCDPRSTAVAVTPVNDVVWNSMWMCTKFEHPIPPIHYPPESSYRDTANTADALVTATLQHALVTARQRRRQNCAFVTSCVPVESITKASVEQFAEEIISKENIVDVTHYPFVPTTGIGIIVFHVMMNIT